MKKKIFSTLSNKPTEFTLGIIKPDAYKRKVTGEILAMIEKSELTIKKLSVVKLSISKANNFYAIHKSRSFFKELINYMCSGEIVVFVLSGENAVSRYRELIGNTDPKKAKKGTIRKKFGIDKEKNAVHGSDSKTNAIKEIRFFFGKKS